MLNVGKIEKGIVLDHIKAGRGMSIYKDLNLDKLDCCVAIIQNARSGKIGRKDIIKIEDSLENVDLDALGYIDPNITINIIGDTAKVYGARKILDEMIYNLCDNAIKYNKESGTVDVIINQANNKTSVTVRDTGIGIPQSEQSRVFERFYRVDKSHSKLVGGTGLGLAIVKHGAAFHDAEVSLESTERKGTSVTITFAQ